MTKNNLISPHLIQPIKKAIPSVSRLFAPVVKTWNRSIPNLNVSIEDSSSKALYITSYHSGKLTEGIRYV